MSDIQKIGGKWYYRTENWELLDEPDEYTKQRCRLYRQGQEDRKASKGCLSANGCYLDGYHEPNETIPPYVNRHEAEAFKL